MCVRAMSLYVWWEWTPSARASGDDRVNGGFVVNNGDDLRWFLPLIANEGMMGDPSLGWQTHNRVVNRPAGMQLLIDSLPHLWALITDPSFRPVAHMDALIRSGVGLHPGPLTHLHALLAGQHITVLAEWVELATGMADQREFEDWTLNAVTEGIFALDAVVMHLPALRAWFAMGYSPAEAVGWMRFARWASPVVVGVLRAAGVTPDQATMMTASTPPGATAAWLVRRVQKWLAAFDDIDRAAAYGGAGFSIDEALAAEESPSPPDITTLHTLAGLNAHASGADRMALTST